jgi:hypothetical protein
MGRSREHNNNKKPAGRPVKHIYEITKETIETTAKLERQAEYERFIRKLSANNYDTELQLVYAQYRQQEPEHIAGTSVFHHNDEEGENEK